MLTKLKKDLRIYSSNEKAKLFHRFFKAGNGEYGEGDKFIGVTVPNCRIIAIKYNNLSLSKLQKLLKSEIHEERLVALLILVEQFKKGDLKAKEKIFNFYLRNTKYINNWDLVDLSSHKIVGEYLLENPHCTTLRVGHRLGKVFDSESSPHGLEATLQGSTFKGSMLLNQLAKSDNLWERRISIISTAAFISRGKFDITMGVSEVLLHDKHDLIHKAVGWMLREVGKRSLETEEKFLKKYYKQMPRTMLRYAIERLPEDLRLQYLNGEK